MADAGHRQLLTFVRLLTSRQALSAQDVIRYLLDDHGIQVTERTVQRDLDTLERAYQAFGITANKRSKPYSWTFDRKRSLDFLALDTHTAIAFDQAGYYLQDVLPVSSYQAITPFVEKARYQLSRVAGGDRRQWSKKYFFLPEGLQLLPAQKPQGITSTVYDAVLDEHMIEVTRSTATEAELLLPYGIIDRRRAQYLVAMYEEGDKFYTFRIDRFTKARDTARSFTRKRFSLSEFAKRQFLGEDEFIEVNLVFFEHSGEHLKETPLSSDQTLSNITHRDQTAILVSATVHDTDELRRWILNFHNYVEVLSPDSLRKEIADTYRSALKYYR